MQCIQSYGGSSSESESDNGEAAAFLLPIDPTDSVANTLSIVTAPEVVPMVSAPNKVKKKRPKQIHFKLKVIQKLNRVMYS